MAERILRDLIDFIRREMARAFRRPVFAHG
jgi:hypothetical protein